MTGTRLALSLSLLLCVGAARAQAVPDTTTSQQEEAVLENLVEEDVTGDPTLLLEDLEALRANPLDVNAAPADDLAQIPALGGLLADRIVRFRESFGPFGSLPEIRAVEGVTADVYLDARPYLTIGRTLDIEAEAVSLYPRVPALGEVVSGLQYEIRQRVQRRLDNQRGYDDVLDTDSTRHYAGSPERFYTRLRATYGRQVSVNLTMEKDPGKPFGWRPDENTYGFDYLSGHLALRRVGRIEALVLGDYTAQFGQGLALWAGSGFGKGREAVRSLSRRGRGLVPYGSVDENAFLRGAGLSVMVTPDLVVSAFGSRRLLDASVTEIDSLDFADGFAPNGVLPGDAIVTSLGATGLHRTPDVLTATGARPGEIARKDALGESLVGGAVEWRPGIGRFGVTGYASRFDDPIQPGTRPEDRFDFSGTEAAAASVFGDARLGDLFLFGEVATDRDGDVGTVGGVEMDLGGGARALALGRHYQPDFQSLRGYGFGERNGATQNETGLYLGLEMRPSRAWYFSGFVDQYRFPYIRFGLDRPGTGVEGLLYAEHRPTRWLVLSLQGRTETRDERALFTQATGAELAGIERANRRSLRAQLDWNASRTIRLRTRTEVAEYTRADARDTGSLVYGDARWQATRWLRVDGRLLYFRTTGYGARLYAFENDVYGVLSNAVLTGRGQRAYVLLSTEPLEDLTLQAKLAWTRFEDAFSVGSGLDEIDGPRVRDLSLSLRYRF
jgi:hypothetical protein